MKELSLHVLDIAENSVKAGAALTEIELVESSEDKTLVIRIKDNGCGMDKEFLRQVTDPFTTTRTTRKVGLGIPLFKAAAEMTGGCFDIASETGSGTIVTARFKTDHIDFMPVGDMAGTFVTLVRGHPERDFIYRREKDGRSFELSTAEVKEVMQGVPVSSFEVCEWMQDFINEKTTEILLGGNI
mgnify:CR=1 FL=1